MKKLKHFILFLIVVLLPVLFLNAQEKTYNYNVSWGKEGLSIVQQSGKKITINFSIKQFIIKNNMVNGENMVNVLLPGSFLPNDAGYPDLPGNGRFIAIPQGSKPLLKVVSYRTEIIKDVNLAPAFIIPPDIDNKPLVYEKNPLVYSKNEYYPANPVIISEPGKIRGVDVVTLGITPFQYNPVTKELLVYKDISIEISYESGNGHFGDDAFRSRWFDPILEDAILNYADLPKIDYDKRLQDWINSKETGCEYLIIVPNNPEFSQWADSVKKFRTEQGILTKIVKLQDIPNGTSYVEIKNYVTDAYTNWTIKPVACLLMADYGQNPANTIDAILYPDPPYGNFPCDNYYADVNYDEMPDIVFARLTANDDAQLQVQCSKVFNYERNPPTDAGFYNSPITALGWQTERWFQLCSEIVGGYFKTKGKTPVRVNALYSGNPYSDPWSTAPNTSVILSFFGPGGLNYIPATPQELGGFTGGTGTMVNAAINSGSFMLQHRDHGEFTAWGEPYYTTSYIYQLTNVDNKLPFVFSINCQTGGYHYGGGNCLAEGFHRHTYNGFNSGALGAIGAAEVSYSFVNDTYAWGMYDNMWPDFMPPYGSTPESRGILPAFGNAAGKYFLMQSGWPYNTGNKLITYRLFHMFGDAFLTMYSEIPQNLTVSHSNCVTVGDTIFNVTANAGAFIALSLNGEILGTAIGTGSPVEVKIPATIGSGKVIVTITKTNYFRYTSEVNVVLLKPNASFTYSMNGKTFAFTNTSTNAKSYDWDFGDATPHSTETNPVHTYENFGNYTVTLIAKGECPTSTSTKSELLTIIDGINENDMMNNNIFIIPNPNNGLFNISANIKLSDIVSLRIFNSLNIVVYENNNVTINGNIMQSIDLSRQPAGIYYVMIETQNKKIIKKFSIQK